MNAQDILYPIQDLFYWIFDILEAAANNFNYLLMAAFSIAIVYWISKLLGYEKDEVLNR
ncbi:MAG: hypothetical protein QF371_02705 [Flavobacteriales bacterium]|jgi:hypothetical protein|nr:hypothetical protein [Flavobacteriales bacterium]